MILANWGSAWGTWRAGIGVCEMGINYSKGVIKNIVPIVMAGVLGIYGLIVAVIITQSIAPPSADQATTYSLYNGYSHVRCIACELVKVVNVESQSFLLIFLEYYSSQLVFVVAFRALQLVEPSVSLERLASLALDSRRLEESGFGMDRETEAVTTVAETRLVATRQALKMPTNSMSAYSSCSFSVKPWHYSE